MPSMSDFDSVRLHCLKLEILGQIGDLLAVNTAEIASEPIDEAPLRDLRPVHETSAGMREARFQRMDRWSDGNPVAYYQAFCRNPDTGKFERYAWRYMLRNGQLIPHKTFPVIVEDWKDKKLGIARSVG
jgi:hypothetical protein